MKKLLCLWSLCLAVALPLPVVAADDAAAAVFELRIYHPAPGKAEAMLARFRNHTCAIFERLGAVNVGYWTETQPAEGMEPKLYYVLRHANRDAARQMWATFRDDPEWIAARDASEANGRLVNKVDVIFMGATDFSAIK